MKKIKLEGKLSINKEIISKLNDAEMQKALGAGAVFSISPACDATWRLKCEKPSDGIETGALSALNLC